MDRILRVRVRGFLVIFLRPQPGIWCFLFFICSAIHKVLLMSSNHFGFFVFLLGSFFFVCLFICIFVDFGIGGRERLSFAAGGADYHILQ